MQVNIQGVEYDLRRTEQIDLKLYNNEDTQRVIQELAMVPDLPYTYRERRPP